MCWRIFYDVLSTVNIGSAGKFAVWISVCGLGLSLRFGSQFAVWVSVCSLDLSLQFGSQFAVWISSTDYDTVEFHWVCIEGEVGSRRPESLHELLFECALYQMQIKSNQQLI